MHRISYIGTLQLRIGPMANLCLCQPFREFVHSKDGKCKGVLTWGDGVCLTKGIILIIWVRGVKSAQQQLEATLTYMTSHSGGIQAPG